jgi:hypothetical protein
MSLIKHALEYASDFALFVFPCDPRNKRPLVSRGLHEATRDTETITRWWTQWPMAQIAVATGAKSGIVVLDVDTKGEVSGFEALAKLRAQEDLPADAMSVRTPSGGRHYWFAWDKDRPLANSASAIGKGLDVRGEGGYVIAPPSLKGLAQPYTWDPRGPLYLPPEWMHRKAQPAPAPHREYRPTTEHEKSAYARKAIAEELRAVAHAPEGQRNHQLNQSSFALFRLVHECGISANKLEAGLLEAATDAGLSKIEALNTIRSARKARGVA